MDLSEEEILGRHPFPSTSDSPLWKTSGSLDKTLRKLHKADVLLQYLLDRVYPYTSIIDSSGNVLDRDVSQASVQLQHLAMLLGRVGRHPSELFPNRRHPLRRGIDLKDITNSSIFSAHADAHTLDHAVGRRLVPIKYYKSSLHNTALTFAWPCGFTPRGPTAWYQLLTMQTHASKHWALKHDQVRMWDVNLLASNALTALQEPGPRKDEPHFSPPFVSGQTAAAFHRPSAFVPANMTPEEQLDSIGLPSLINGSTEKDPAPCVLVRSILFSQMLSALKMYYGTMRPAAVADVHALYQRWSNITTISQRELEHVYTTLVQGLERILWTITVFHFWLLYLSGTPLCEAISVFPASMKTSVPDVLSLREHADYKDFFLYTLVNFDPLIQAIDHYGNVSLFGLGNPTSNYHTSDETFFSFPPTANFRSEASDPSGTVKSARTEPSVEKEPFFLPSILRDSLSDPDSCVPLELSTFSNLQDFVLLQFARRGLTAPSFSVDASPAWQTSQEYAAYRDPAPPTYGSIHSNFAVIESLYESLNRPIPGEFTHLT